MKIKDFFLKMGWIPASERFQFYSDIWRCRKLPWMEKWRRVLHRQCYFFFLCCLFQQNDKSSTFHDGLSAVWPLDPGRILGRDGSHVWPESHDVTVCGTKVQVKRCRGTCRSISRITMGFPYYRKYCQCCQGNKFTDKTVSCAGGDHKKIRLPAGSSCEDCLA